MSFLDKLKNVFFEEEEIEEAIEEQEKPKLARKVEIPKKKPLVFEEEETKAPPVAEPEEVKVVETVTREVKVEPKIEPTNNFTMLFEEEDFVIEEKPKVMSREVVRERAEKRELYPPKKEESYTESIRKDNGYGYTKSYYESKETKTFKPSPIISPIYGILDKNYKKEEVITRKEIKITSNRDKVDLDTVRSKAFGHQTEEVEPKEIVNKIEKEEKIYNVNTTKPTVKGVTLEDADEYYRDLGLAYNVDYSDKGKENTMSRVEKEKEKESRLEDNLFDLIESMYDKED